MSVTEMILVIVAAVFMGVVMISEYLLWSAVSDIMKEFRNLDKAFNVHRHPGRRQGDK